MKKSRIILALLLTVTVFTGCETEAQRVTYNLSQQATNFNIVRQLTAATADNQ